MVDNQQGQGKRCFSRQTGESGASAECGGLFRGAYEGGSRGGLEVVVDILEMRGVCGVSKKINY
jgi:hypothetical protein